MIQETMCREAAKKREGSRRHSFMFSLRGTSRSFARSRPHLVFLLLAVVVMTFITGCDTELPTASPRDLLGSSADVGREKIAYYGCASCHTIPGVKGADGLVGPSLEHLANRAYIGGMLENSPANLVRWIQNPPAVDPKTAMPDVRVNEPDARAIAAYLYSLK